MFKCRNKGMTVVEIMVVVGVLGIIFWGVIKLLSKTTDMWFIGKGQLDLQDSAREAMYWLGQDFRNAKASSMGNRLISTQGSGGFEDPLALPDAPDGWEPLTKNIRRFSAGTDPYEVKNGLYSMSLLGKTTFYSSAIFQVPANQNHIFSLWARIDGSALARCYNATGSFALSISSTFYALPRWVHLTTNGTNPNAGDTSCIVRLHTNGDWGTITIIDDNGRWGTYTLNPYEVPYVVYADMGGSGNLEMAHWDKSSYSWVKENLGFGCPWEWYSLAVNRAGHARLAYTPSGWIWLRYSWDDGSGWQHQDVDLPPPSGCWVPEQICLQLDRMDIPAICYIVRYGSGFNIDTWYLKYAKYNSITSSWNVEQVATGPCAHAFGTESCSLVLDSGDTPHIVYFNYETGQVKYVKKDGSNWSEEIIDTVPQAANTYNLPVSIAIDQYGYPCIAYSVVRGGGKMDIRYAQKQPNGNWSYSWIDKCGSVYENSMLAIDEDNNPCVVYGVGYNTSDGSQQCTLRLARWNGSSWVITIVANDYFNTSNEAFVQHPFLMLDRDYFPHIGWFDWAHNAIKYVKTCQVNYDDVSVSPTEVTFSPAGTVTNYEYYTVYSTGNPPGRQWTRYRLEYQPTYPPDSSAPGKLFRRRLEGSSWIPVGITQSGAICENVKSFKITNRNQETFEVELVLEKQISANRIREYRLKNTFTPLVP